MWELVMSTAVPPRPDHADWKALYRAAILETNRRVIPRRVSAAEQAVLARGRELFYRGGTSEEKESLEDALYLLRAYRDACEHADVEVSAVAKTAA
jgi:hypothetical protein